MSNDIARQVSQMMGFVVTDRDIEILRLASIFGVITRPQIQRALNWSCVSDVTRRLRKLASLHLLDCAPRRQAADGGHVFRLGSAGSTVLHHSDESDLAALAHRRAKYSRLKDGLLRHELLTAEVGCALRGSLRRRPDSGLLEWCSADELSNLCSFDGGIAAASLKPDAYFAFHVGALRANAFLEADCGTESLRRISAKIEYYQAFKISGHFQERFLAKAFRLLIVTLSSIRAASIRNHVGLVRDLRVFAASVEHFELDFLSAPIWISCNDPDSKRLHSLVKTTQGDL